MTDDNEFYDRVGRAAPDAEEISLAVKIRRRQQRFATARRTSAKELLDHLTRKDN